jgi:hypothetical protein
MEDDDMSSAPDYKAKVRPHGPMDELPAVPVTHEDEQADIDLSTGPERDPALADDIEAGLVPDDVMAQTSPEDAFEPEALTGEDGPVPARTTQDDAGTGAEGSAARAGPEASRSIAREGRD